MALVSMELSKNLESSTRVSAANRASRSGGGQAFGNVDLGLAAERLDRAAGGGVKMARAMLTGSRR